MIKILHKWNISVMSAFCAVLVLGLITLFSPKAFAQVYPTKPIRIIVTSTPGSGVDIIARLIGAKLTEAWGQQIVVDNRAGASGRIAAEVAARSAPDGYTLMVMTSQLAVVAAMYEKLKYDLIKDFTPISLLCTTPSILAVNPSIPVTSVKELVMLAKSRPGVLRYGSGGSGSFPHLAVEIFKSMTGTDILHVPYKGTTLAITGMMSGEVHMSVLAVNVCLPIIKSGKLRALGVTTSKRTPQIPDLPSISESVPGYEFIGWTGMIAPAKTPPAILSKLNTDVVKAMNTSAVREQMMALGVDPLGTPQKDFALFISDQLKKMREAVRLSGARPED